MVTMNLWETVPGICGEIPTLTAYIPENKKSDTAVVILPGGGYIGRSEHEGKGYADFTFHPRRKNDITFIVELKKDEIPEVAIEQIKGKEYAEKFRKENKDKKDKKPKKEKKEEN